MPDGAHAGFPAVPLGQRHGCLPASGVGALQAAGLGLPVLDPSPVPVKGSSEQLPPTGSTQLLGELRSRWTQAPGPGLWFEASLFLARWASQGLAAWTPAGDPALCGVGRLGWHLRVSPFSSTTLRLRGERPHPPAAGPCPAHSRLRAFRPGPRGLQSPSPRRAVPATGRGKGSRQKGSGWKGRGGHAGVTDDGPASRRACATVGQPPGLMRAPRWQAVRSTRPCQRQQACGR